MCNESSIDNFEFHEHFQAYHYAIQNDKVFNTCMERKFHFFVLVTIVDVSLQETISMEVWGYARIHSLSIFIVFCS